MDDKRTQSAGHRIKEGHEESDISIRGIVLFGVFLAVGGVLSFISMGGLMWAFEWAEKKWIDKPLTPMEQVRIQQAAAPPPTLGKEVPEDGEAKTTPDYYGRGKMEDHLDKVFRAPRLQYDDEHDMGLFRNSENQWLASTGKDTAGHIHIPVEHAMDLLLQRGLPAVSGPFLPANVGAPSAQFPTGGPGVAAAAGNRGAQKK